MKGIEFFNPITERAESEDLPWLKDWVKGTKEHDIDNEVITVYPGDKGLLMLTGVYKCFVFRNNSIHNYLIEALEHWVKTGSSVSPLVIVSNIKGRASYGLNHDKPVVKWIESDGSYTSVRLDEPIKLNLKRENPFLMIRPPDPDNPTQNGSNKKKVKPTERPLQEP